MCIRDRHIHIRVKSAELFIIKSTIVYNPCLLYTSQNKKHTGNVKNLPWDKKHINRHNNDTVLLRTRARVVMNIWVCTALDESSYFNNLSN